MRTLLRLLLPLALLAGAAASRANSNTVAVAVVVNAANPVDNLSREELGRILRQEKQFWDGNSAIELHLPAAGQPGRAVLRLENRAENEAALKKQWLARLFRGQSKREPAQHETPAALAAKVAEQPNALGLLAAGPQGGAVKVLSIDGRKPGEPGYPLIEGPLAP